MKLGDIVFDGDPLPPPKKKQGAQQFPSFGLCQLLPTTRASQLLLSTCYLEIYVNSAQSYQMTGRTHRLCPNWCRL